MTKVVTRQQFIDWLKTKPADKPACLGDTGHCVMAEYAREVLAVEDPIAAVSTVVNHYHVPVATFSWLKFWEFSDAETYGEVVEDLEKGDYPHDYQV